MAGHTQQARSAVRGKLCQGNLLPSIEEPARPSLQKQHGHSTMNESRWYTLAVNPPSCCLPRSGGSPRWSMWTIPRANMTSGHNVHYQSQFGMLGISTAHPTQTRWPQLAFHFKNECTLKKTINSYFRLGNGGLVGLGIAKKPKLPELLQHFKFPEFFPSVQILVTHVERIRTLGPSVWGWCGRVASRLFLYLSNILT